MKHELEFGSPQEETQNQRAGVRGYWSASENSNIKSDENSELKAGEVRIPGVRSRD